MNVPKIRFREFNDEWQQINLENTFTYYSTNSLSREQLSEDGTIRNIHYGDIHRKFSTIVDIVKDVDTFIKDPNYKNKYELCRNNDLIFADASEDYEGIGKAIEIINVNEDIISGLHTILARDSSNKFSPKFKGYYFNSPVVHNQIKILANGFKVYGISKDTINKLEVKIPTKDEQIKIANILELLDKKIELQTKKIEDLKLFKKGLLQKEFNKIKSTNLVELKEVANIYQPQTLSQNQLNDGKYVVFGANGIIGKHNVYNHEQAQVTISCRGENSGTINVTPSYCWINGNSMVINIDDSEVITKEYLKFILESQNLKYLISGSGQPQIVRNVVEKHKIPIISMQSQFKYYNKFKILENKIELEFDKLSYLKKIKKGLMQSMFV